jgi:1-acyl-sn-glycerol-3-phosphate acyltransferase
MSKPGAVPAPENPTKVVRPSSPRRTYAPGHVLARASLWIRAFRLFVKLIFLLFFRVRVHGLENVPRGPVIVCANHLGWADAFLILLFLPVEPRIYVLGDRNVLDISSFRTRVIMALRILVPLDRSKPVEAVRVMEGVLKRGGSLLIFPEGALGTKEGELLALEPGAAYLSVRSGVPLLPVGLTGTSELWLRRTLVVRIGKPIYPDAFTGDTASRVNAITDALGRAMRALLPGDRERPRVRLLRRWLTNLF